MPAFTLVLILILAYLLGSIPFGYLLVRFFRQQDIRATGSGNIGATNVVRSGAKGLGAATFLLDALKGFVAVALARSLVHSSLPAWPPLAPIAWQGSLAVRLDVATGLAAIAAVLGHIYPVWLHFKGGKGVATAFGALLQLVPFAAVVGLIVFIVTVWISRYVSLASIAGAVAIPLAALLHPAFYSLVHGTPDRGYLWHFTHHPWGAVALLVIPAIVVAKHQANIGRLAAGTEYRFGRAKPQAS